MWRSMSDRPQFTYSMPGVFCNAKAFVLSCDKLSRDDDRCRLLYYLVGVMNSAAVGWYGRKVASTTGAGLLQWLKFSVEIIPVPEPGSDVSQEIATCVARIIEDFKRRSTDYPKEKQVFTHDLTGCIDGIVCDLYGLSASERGLLLRTLSGRELDS